MNITLGSQFVLQALYPATARAIRGAGRLGPAGCWRLGGGAGQHARERLAR
jgi:hypothetical protein